MSGMLDKIKDGRYLSTLPYRARKDDPQAYAVYHSELDRLEALFRAELLEALGVTGHPKADLLFSKAWELGHSSGHEEVYQVASDLVELIR